MNDHFKEQLQLLDIEIMAKDADIAIVDDDFSFSLLMKDYLIQSCDFEAALFEDGESFLKDYKKNDKRIIILDYDFGKGQNINGLSILSKIKEKNNNAVVIMVSGQDDIEIAIQAMRSGATDYFIKTNKTVFANVVSCIMKVLALEKHKLN
jgi:FixJ family two-component response regulator